MSFECPRNAHSVIRSNVMNGIRGCLDKLNRETEMLYSVLHMSEGVQMSAQLQLFSCTRCREGDAGAQSTTGGHSFSHFPVFPSPCPPFCAVTAGKTLLLRRP